MARSGECRLIGKRACPPYGNQASIVRRKASLYETCEYPRDKAGTEALDDSITKNDKKLPLAWQWSPCPNNTKNAR